MLGNTPRQQHNIWPLLPDNRRQLILKRQNAKVQLSQGTTDQLTAESNKESRMKFISAGSIGEFTTEHS
jgi:hypothetical protein